MTRRLFLLCIVVILLAPVGRLSAQNTWEAFWNGMETALMALGTNPTQAYFDQLYHPDLPNRDRYFQSLVAEANALSDMKVSYPVLIFDGARAAYQRVVTGTFSQPYVAGSTTLPPTNAPVRYVTQGIMVVSGAGRIFADYAVTDGFAKFQEFGAIPLAPGQEHGQIGLQPYAGDSADSTFAPGFSEFTRFARTIHAPLRRQDGEDLPITLPPETIDEMARLLTIDANGNDANSPEFDPNTIVQFGTSSPIISPPPEITLNAAVHQDDWSAGYFTFTAPPGTTFTVTLFADPLTTSAPLDIPYFAILHSNEVGQIDLMFIDVDTLGILNQLGVNPGDMLIAEPAEQEAATGQDWESQLETASSGENITLENVNDLVSRLDLDRDLIQQIAGTPLTTLLSQDESWLIQNMQIGIFNANDAVGAFSGDGTKAALSRGAGGTVIDLTTNQPIFTFPSDLQVNSIIFDDQNQTAIVGSPTQVLAFEYSGEVRTTLDLGNEAAETKFDPNTGLLAIAGVDGFVRVVDGENIVIALDTTGTSKARSLFYQQGTRVITIGSNGTVRAWDTTTWERLQTIETRGVITSIDTNVDGSIAAIGYAEGGVDVFGLGEGTKLTTLETGGDPVLHVSFNPANSLLFTFAADDQAQVWGVTEAQQTSSTTGGEQTSSSLPTTTPTPAPTSIPSPAPSGATCPVRPTTNANIRSNPDANSARVDTAQTGVEEVADGFTQAADGFTWYRLQGDGWIRGDLVVPGEGCENLPNVEAP